MTEEDKLDFKKWRNKTEREAIQKAFEEEAAERDAQKRGMEGIEGADEDEEKAKGINTVQGHIPE